MSQIRHRVSIVLALLALGLASVQVAAAPSPANIVVIVADDLGYADVGFQGCKDIPTPHLDALAKRGIVCTQAYVSHPFCSPTRAGLLTGRYQQRFGHENNPAWLPDDKTVGLPLDQVTLADLLKKAGYKTGAIGKWHLGAHPVFHPNRRGFDEYFGFLGGGHQYHDHNQFKTNPAKAKQEYFIPLLRNDKPVEETEYLTDALGREAVAFVEAHKAERFFLYLAFNAPHTPLQAPAKYLDRVKGIKDDKLGAYAAMVCGMDDAVGAVMAKLKEHKLDENTLVFFFSDNGGPTGVTNCRNTPLRGAKGQLYEGGIRVPFVVSWPAWLQRELVHEGKFTQPVSTLDVFPTALAAAGVKPPADLKLDGYDLIGHFRGEIAWALVNRLLFWRTGGGEHFAALKGTTKLVLAGKGPELYQLADDIGEEKNLAEEQPDLVKVFKTHLDRWNATLVEPRWSQPAQVPKKK